MAGEENCCKIDIIRVADQQSSVTQKTVSTNPLFYNTFT